MNRTAWLQERRMLKFRDVLSRWEASELSALEASELLGMSERQFRRYRARFEDEGEKGLLDRRLGKASSRRVPESERRRMLDLYREMYPGWNVRHFHDRLRSHHGFSWGYSWTKMQLQLAGLVERTVKRGPHRRKRERKPYAGMMLHQDGSRAHWLMGAPPLDLIVTMDDATSEIYSAILVEEEGTDSTFRGLLETFSARGLPCSLYTDRGSHYFHTPEAGGKVDRDNLTQVGRALAHLGVEHIAAYSPQARGRSERMFGTLQDRLIKELALTGVADIETANAWLREVWLPAHNARFAVKPAFPDDAFVPVADRSALMETLCRHEDRVVARDNTVGFENKRLQLPESPLRHHWVGAKVRIHVYPDSSLAVFHGPRLLARYHADGELLSSPARAAVAPAKPAASRRTLALSRPSQGLDRRQPSPPQRKSQTRRLSEASPAPPYD
jgi:transposase